MINHFKLYELINEDKIVGIKAISDLHFYYENKVRIQLEKCFKEILEKAGFKDYFTILNCIKRDWIKIECYDKFKSTIYRVYIGHKLFAELRVDHIHSLEDYKIEVSYSITYF